MSCSFALCWAGVTPIKTSPDIVRLCQEGIEQVGTLWLYHRSWKGSLRGMWLQQDPTVIYNHDNIFLSIHFFYNIHRYLLILFIFKKMKRQFCDVGKAFMSAWTIYHKLPWWWWNGGSWTEITGSLIPTKVYHICWDCCRSIFCCWWWGPFMHGWRCQRTESLSTAILSVVKCSHSRIIVILC